MNVTARVEYKWRAMTKVYKTEAQAEAAKSKAARFVEDVIGDPDRAGEIEDENLDEWLSETGRRIEPNPKKNNRRTNMAKAKKTPAEYAAEIRALRDERDSLAEENDELNTLLDDIQSLSGDGGDDDDDVDTDDDDDDD